MAEVACSGGLEDPARDRDTRGGEGGQAGAEVGATLSGYQRHRRGEEEEGDSAEPWRPRG